MKRKNSTRNIDLIDLDNNIRGLDFPSLYDKTYSDYFKESVVFSLGHIVWFALLLIYLETVYHLWCFKSINILFLLKLFMCIPSAAILALFVNFFTEKANKVITWCLTAFAIIYYIVNILYRAIFKVFFTIALVDRTNMKVIQYYREIIEGIKENWFVLCLIVFIPIAALIILNRFKTFCYKRVLLKCAYVPVAALLIVIGIECLIVPLFGKDTYDPYDLMKNESYVDFTVEKIGLLASAEIDIRNLLFPRDLTGNDTFDVWVYDPNAKHGSQSTASTSDNEPEIKPTDIIGVSDAENNPLTDPLTGEDNPPITGEPGADKTDADIIEDIIAEIDTSPNMLNLDFVSLSENEADETIASLHKYFASIEPTYKNEYTGMFKGFNLILMTAESFSTLAVDEELTPTLYKLTHEGFIFNNFYNPRTSGSTSDGEFIVSTSLHPANGGARNFKTVGQRSMPFTLGSMFNRNYGITSRAFHDNDFAYYGRDISYPSLGLYYKGIGNGLDMKTHWPSSDLDMMKASIPDYIDDELFYVYYMTVSGHLNYNFTGNWCAKVHKDDVANLPYSDACKAYIACNMEFDLALEYLIEQLEEKNIADRTVICFTGDHWPYGLSNEEISEILGHKVEEEFELYKSSLVLWSGAIKEPIIIDKQCCSMDILPTLLNLFGFDYDSRLLMGRDILSDSEGFVGFNDRSFITDRVMYNVNTREVTNLTDEELPENYVSDLKKMLNNQWKYTKLLMLNDYYRYICDVLGITAENAIQNYTPDYSRFTP